MLEYLCTKWSDIPNLLTRLQLYYVDNNGNIIGNLIYNLNLPVVDSLFQHPSMNQLTIPANEQGPVFPLFYMLVPEDSFQGPPPLSEHAYEEHPIDLDNHEDHSDMNLALGGKSSMEEEHQHAQQDHNNYSSTYLPLNQHSLLDPFHTKKGNDHNATVSSTFDNFSRFPDQSPSLLGVLGDSCIDNILAQSSMLMGANQHSVGAHEFSRLLKNLASNTKEPTIISKPTIVEKEIKGKEVKEERELTPSGKLKHSFSHIFESEDSRQKLELDSSSKESSPTSVTDAKSIEGPKEIGFENDLKRKFSEDIPTESMHTTTTEEEPSKKKKKLKLKQKKLIPLRIITTETTVLPSKPLSGEKMFIARLCRVGRSRPELRRINPTFVRPL